MSVKTVRPLAVLAFTFTSLLRRLASCSLSNRRRYGSAQAKCAVVADLLFEVLTPLGFTVHCTDAYWRFIVSVKHPVLTGQDNDIQRVLIDPDQVRQSRKDSRVFLFYRGDAPRWLCAVVKREGDSAFLVTAYPTDSIKAGEAIWTKSK